MSLATFQACLTRLYVDEAFRASFAKSPAAAMQGYGLAEPEVDALAALDLVEVERFGRTLRAKHRSRLARRYPLAAADRERFDAAHMCFYLLHGPGTDAAFDAQAIAFGRFVDEMYGRDARADASGAAPAWYEEIARYERQRLIAMQGRAKSAPIACASR